MKRRNFLQTGSLGLLSLGLPANVFSLASNRQPCVQDWLRQLALAVTARRKSGAFGWPQDLKRQIEQTDAFMAGRGFFRESSGAFFCANGATCFYPLLLRRASVNLSELLVPVFNRQPDGSWKRLAVLTSYQLEALDRAAAALADQKTPIHELLLPAGAAPASGSMFSTLHGSVSMVTQLSNGLAQTEIVVREGQNVVFSESFRSQHTLSSTPIKNA